MQFYVPSILLLLGGFLALGNFETIQICKELSQLRTTSGGSDGSLSIRIIEFGE